MKKIKYLIIGGLCVCAFSCQKSEKRKSSNIKIANDITTTVNSAELDVENISKEERTDSLNYLFNRLQVSKNKTSQNRFSKRYFRVFPNNFETFKELYSRNQPASKEKNAVTLRENSENHVDQFFKLESGLLDSLFIRKVINIAIGGKWERGAVNRFKVNLYSLVNSNCDLFYSVLKTYDAEQINNFWIFYFDTPKVYTVRTENLKQFEKLDEEMYKIITLHYQEALKRKPEGQ